MNELIRAALVIARRDYIATVWSKTFLFFLIGPLFPIIFGVVFGSVGTNVDHDMARPTVGISAEAATAKDILDARARIAARIGETALPELRVVPLNRDPAHLLADKTANIAVVLSGGLDKPTLIGPRRAIDMVRGGVGLVVDEAHHKRALGYAPTPLPIAEQATTVSVRADKNGRRLTARTSQLVLLLLTMILAGMLLSNLIEEKSNKVIEVLAAAVPVDAIFLGKLLGMLAMSLTGIAIWGGTAAITIMLLFPAAAANFPVPAIGWTAFTLLGVAYFTTSYLLLGAVFLGIGAQASTAREVQTLSMPVTMAQLVVFAFASSGVGSPDSGLAVAAASFPWSSPFAMLARAAQTPAIWPHLLAIGWQGLWVAITIRIAAGYFRVSVLKSGGHRRFFRPKRPA